MINMDFTIPLGVRWDDEPWAPSPAPGVERKRLEREAAEHGHTTSFVRYAAQSAFSEHTHVGGEEYLVLDGTFSDEDGDAPAWTYVRNPIASSHAPRSEEGCVIFVKLAQMRASETETTRVDLNALGEGEHTLHADSSETVTFVRSGAEATHEVSGAEVVVLAGKVRAEGAVEGDFPRWSWIRVPKGTQATLRAASGATLWIKTFR